MEVIPPQSNRHVSDLPTYYGVNVVVHLTGGHLVPHSIQGAISQHHSLVVATGGGVVVQPENWGILRQGIIVWLNIDRDQLLMRLDADNTRRPLLQTANPATALDTILEARLSLYSEADLQITIGAENLNEVADQILKCLSKQLRSLGDLTLLQTTAR